MTGLCQKEGGATRGLTLTGTVPRDEAMVHVGCDYPVSLSELAVQLVPLKFLGIHWQKRQVFPNERKFDSLK